MHILEEHKSPNIRKKLNGAARLKPGVTVAGARAQLKIVGAEFRKANPAWGDAGERVAVVPVRDARGGEVRNGEECGGVVLAQSIGQNVPHASVRH